MFLVNTNSVTHGIAENRKPNVGWRGDWHALCARWHNWLENFPEEVVGGSNVLNVFHNGNTVPFA